MVLILVGIQNYFRVFTTIIQLYLTLLVELVNIFFLYCRQYYLYVFFLVINDSASQQYLPEHISVDRPLHCQPVGIVNDICQTAYNLGGAENHQNSLPKDYTDQSVRWAEIFRDKKGLFRHINIFNQKQK